MSNDKPHVFVFPIAVAVLFQLAGISFMAVSASNAGLPTGQFKFGVSTLLFGACLIPLTTQLRAWLPRPLLALVALVLLSGLAAQAADAWGWLPASAVTPTRWALVIGGIGVLAATVTGWALHERIPPA